MQRVQHGRFSALPTKCCPVEMQDPASTEKNDKDMPADISRRPKRPRQRDKSSGVIPSIFLSNSHHTLQKPGSSRLPAHNLTAKKPPQQPCGMPSPLSTTVIILHDILTRDAPHTPEKSRPGLSARLVHVDSRFANTGHPPAVPVLHLWVSCLKKNFTSLDE